MYIPQPLLLVATGIILGLVTFIIGLFTGVHSGFGTGVNESNRGLYKTIELLLGLASWTALILVGGGVVMFVANAFA